MSLRVCPIANVHAPVSRVWAFLARPECYALWWDARTQSIRPPGESQPGQRIHAHSRKFGILWTVDVLVEDVDAVRHVLDVMASLPLGIFLFNHISLLPLGASSCQVSFASDFSFSPVWWGWLLERFAGQQLYAGVATVVSRLKQAAEAVA
jgi:hypothetical protein